MKILREIVSPLIAVLLAFLVGAIIILLIKDNPFETYRILLANSFGSMKDIGYTLFIATPLIFTGLAVAVAFPVAVVASVPAPAPATDPG